MSPAQEFACHMRFQQPWMSRAIRDWHDELYAGACEAWQLSELPVSTLEGLVLAEALNELAAHLRYASIYVVWYGVQES